VNVNGADAPLVLVTMTFAEVFEPTEFGIVTSSCVSESIRRPVPVVPPNVTERAGPPFEMKFDPVIVTSHPASAVLGVTAVTVATAAYAVVAANPTSSAENTTAAAIPNLVLLREVIRTPSLISLPTNDR
jgi:hypothetical protein